MNDLAAIPTAGAGGPFALPAGRFWLDEVTRDAVGHGVDRFTLVLHDLVTGRTEPNSIRLKEAAEEKDARGLAATVLTIWAEDKARRILHFEHGPGLNEACVPCVDHQQEAEIAPGEHSPEKPSPYCVVCVGPMARPT